jgi:DNA polymerase III alpha subunit
VLATNYIYNQAAKDGTVIAVVANSIPLHQLIDGKGVRYDARKFNWIGSTGIANLVVWPSLMERFRKVVMGARLVRVDAVVQRSPEGIVHLVIAHIADRTSDLAGLSNESMPTALARADEVRRPIPEGRAHHPRNTRVLPKSRDFH